MRVRRRIRALVEYGLTELVHRAEDRLNRRLLPRRVVARTQARWEPWPGSRPTAPVGAECLIVVTTYGRARAYAALMASLADASAQTPELGRFHVLVLDDGSPRADYAAAHDGVVARFGERTTILRSTHNLGKAGYWQTVQRAFDECRRARIDRMLFLQDDLELAPFAIRDALSIWDEIVDSRKAVLNLFAADSDEPGGRWVQFPRREPPNARFRETAWFDMAAFLVGPRFWEIVGHRMFPIHGSRWGVRPEISSGVGRQLTRRLWGRGAIYQVRETVVYHGGERSQMNLEARAARPMDNRKKG